MYKRLAPSQEKMFATCRREIDDMDEADSWKTEDEDDSTDPPNDE